MTGIVNLAARGLTDAELMGELERRGLDIGKLAFDLVQYYCMERNKRWSSTSGQEYTILERAAELGEEAGEAMGAAKKLRRVEMGLPGNRQKKTPEEMRAHLAYELGDVLVTAANLANKGGVSLWEGLKVAFNTRSQEMGYPERL